MTNKKRKISLVTRVNVNEHQIISDACKTANYNTIGSFIRDTLICSLTEEDSLHGITVPTQTAEEMAKHPAAFPALHITSAEKGMGIAELRAAVLGDAGV